MQTSIKRKETLTGQIRDIKIGKYRDFPIEKRNTICTIRDRLGFEGYKFKIESSIENGIVRVHKLSNPKS